MKSPADSSTLTNEPSDSVERCPYLLTILSFVETWDSQRKLLDSTSVLGTPSNRIPVTDFPIQVVRWFQQRDGSGV
jgi:hypothetical protein